MDLREAMAQVAGFRYVVEALQVHSGPGLRLRAAMEYMRDAGAIREALDQVEAVEAHLQQREHPVRVDLLETLLCDVQDVSGSVEFLRARSARDDIELFQVKQFALSAQRIRAMLAEASFPVVRIPDLEDVVVLLDPQGKRIPEFYIYDEYSSELAGARKELLRLQRDGADEHAQEAQRLKCVGIEDQVRREISVRLRPLLARLAQAIAQVGLLDLLLAKVSLNRELGLTKPLITEGETSYEGLFQPEIAATLAAKKRAFQPLDLRLVAGVTLVTGANMAGKSVLLQCISLAQHMAQFGLYVPARRATIVPVARVMTSIGDGQDHLGGLSSFGAEMVRLDGVARAVLAGERPLVLLDELARTTNPVEGRAIVCGVVEFLNAHGVTSVVTTHYSGITPPCRRLKVRGFRAERVHGQLGVDRINEYIDYSLEEDTEGQVPQEALHIARLMGISDELLACCREHM